MAAMQLSNHDNTMATMKWYMLWIIDLLKRAFSQYCSLNSPLRFFYNFIDIQVILQRLLIVVKTKSNSFAY